jgi:hypothetical protein
MIDPRTLSLRLSGVGAFWALFAAAAAIFIAEEVSIAAVNGFWIDEYFSSWVSDPTRPFMHQLLHEIIVDTNPPFYFTALRLVRFLIADPRSAFLALDLLCLAPTLAFTLWMAARAGVLRTGLLAASAFLLSGPALEYFPEGRTYFAGMCVTFAAAWAVGLAVISAGSRRILIALAVLGALASLTHVFAALFAGSFGASLVAIGLLTRRRDLAVCGLVLGGAATLAFAAWIALLPIAFGNVSWITFTEKNVFDAIYSLRILQIGPGFMLLPLAALVGFGAWRQSTRLPVSVFAVGYLLFALLPILISFKAPIIVARYWAVGAPTLVVPLVLMMRAFVMGADRPGRIAAAVAAVFLVAASGFGYATAKRYTAAKSTWQGAATVASLGAGCAPGSIHVAADYFPAFALASRLPSKTFIDVLAPGAAVRRVAEMTCPVVGWREHTEITPDMSDDALLARLALQAAPGEVKIVRHRSGYVVLNMGAAPAR